MNAPSTNEALCHHTTLHDQWGHRPPCGCGTRVAWEPHIEELPLRLADLYTAAWRVARDLQVTLTVEVTRPPDDFDGRWLFAHVFENGTVRSQQSPWPLTDDHRGHEAHPSAAEILVANGWKVPDRLDDHRWLREVGGEVTRVFPWACRDPRRMRDASRDIAQAFLVLFGPTDFAGWTAAAYVHWGDLARRRCIPLPGSDIQ